MPRVYPTVEVTADWPGYGKQKARALAKATKTWVLSIDADERVSCALAAEIQATLQQDKTITGYYIPFINMFCGQIMRHGNWHGRKSLRLFRRTQGQFNQNEVHESIELDGKTAKLKHPILHVTHPHLQQALYKLNYYTSLSAKRRHQAGKRASLLKAITHGLWAFIRGYIIRAGFLDGRRGFLLALLNAEGSFYNYAKMLLRQEGICEDETINHD